MQAISLCDKHVVKMILRDCSDAQYCSQALRDATGTLCVQGDPSEPPQYKVAQIVSDCLQMGLRASASVVSGVHLQIRQGAQDRTRETGVPQSDT